jgi:ferredoxin-NADP reductase
MNLPWYDGIVMDIIPLTATTRLFRIALPPEIDNFTFQPGQFMTFDLPIHEKRHRRWRNYSIASAPDSSNILEFVIVVLEKGAGTTYLFNEVKIGTTITMRGAQGVFTLPDPLPQSELCFICTGTGIAPFRSMLLDMANKQKNHPKMHLIFGTRYEKDILYKTEMENLTQQLDLQYHLALSRETSPDFKGHRGYVHAIYEQLYAQRPDAVFYLCGWNDMLDEAKTRLQNLGYDKKHIIFESYS